MRLDSPRSLKFEYEQYLEREIDEYKDSISRSAILRIGDEAAATLRNEAQATLTEMVLWQEVDRIIALRIGLPDYAKWKRRRLKLLKQFSSLEHWGMSGDSALMHAVQQGVDRHVLVAGAAQEGAALYLAARGCAVTSVEPKLDAVERVMRAAEAAGLTARVRGYCADLGAWSPDVVLHAVVCSLSALSHLSPTDRVHAIDALQRATADGGVHVVQSSAVSRPNDANRSLSSTASNSFDARVLDELQARYQGWTTSVERSATSGDTFLARKQPHFE